MESQIQELYIKNIFGAKSYFQVKVILESIDRKTIIIKSWDGLVKKLKFDETEGCYIVVDEMRI
jgi:hypothetical protein